MKAASASWTTTSASTRRLGSNGTKEGYERQHAHTKPASSARADRRVGVDKDGRVSGEAVAAEALVTAAFLAYVHAHPMGGTDSPAELTIHVAPKRAEAYALWVQFRGGGKLYTVPFVAEAR